MTLRQKLAKVAQPLTYRRAWRRVRRILYPLPQASLLARIDGPGWRELQRRHGSPPPDAPVAWRHYAKYLDQQKYLKLNIRRVQDLNLHRTPPLDLLDIGCGAGYFLFIARTCGHRGLGLDVAGIPVFDEMMELFGVERVVHCIRAFEPLPNLPRSFDLITAFSTAFHGGKDTSWEWGVVEWAFLVTDLERHLKPGGRIFFGLNPAYGGNFYTPELLQFFLSRGAEVERENVLFPPKSVS